MEQYIIKGGNPLVGEVEIGGAKNAALAILAAAIMTDETVLIDNLPDVNDINVLLEAIQGIGAMVQRVDRHTVKINGSAITDFNIEYDYIKDILMRDPEIWNRFKYMYSLKKLHNYNFTLGRIGDEFKREYIQRISREFRRARDNGELKESVFGVREWENLQFMIKDPDGFYEKFYLQSKKERILEKRVKELENSTTLRVGRIVMYVPIKIKRMLKKLRK